MPRLLSHRRRRSACWSCCTSIHECVPRASCTCCEGTHEAAQGRASAGCSAMASMDLRRDVLRTCESDRPESDDGVRARISYSSLSSSIKQPVFRRHIRRRRISCCQNRKSGQPEQKCDGGLTATLQRESLHPEARTPTMMPRLPSTAAESKGAGSCHSQSSVIPRDQVLIQPRRRGGESRPKYAEACTLPTPFARPRRQLALSSRSLCAPSSG